MGTSGATFVFSHMSVLSQSANLSEWWAVWRRASFCVGKNSYWGAKSNNELERSLGLAKGCEKTPS